MRNIYSSAICVIVWLGATPFGQRQVLQIAGNDNPPTRYHYTAARLVSQLLSSPWWTCVCVVRNLSLQRKWLCNARSMCFNGIASAGWLTLPFKVLVFPRQPLMYGNIVSWRTKDSSGRRTFHKMTPGIYTNFSRFWAYWISTVQGVNIAC
jgi:hypothetical protein